MAKTPRKTGKSSSRKSKAISNKSKLKRATKENLSSKSSVRMTAATVRSKLAKMDMSFNATPSKIARTASKFQKLKATPISALPAEIKESIKAMAPANKRIHGAKIALSWFPFPMLFSQCADKFGYMSSTAVRNSSKMDFTTNNQSLLGQLGAMMADPSRASGPDSSVPAGYTYFGQFVDHDITLDVSSSLDAVTDARNINNMRTPAMDLDSLYGRGPALDPFLYDFPAAGSPNSTAIRFMLGTNTNTGVGGPGGAMGPGGMIVHTRRDVPRVGNPANPSAASNTAIIGDPRNDENLIVSQFHFAMLSFHNKIVDMLEFVGFSGDIFAEAKRQVTHHYQHAVLFDFLDIMCGSSAVNDAIATVNAPVGSNFRMPVEFSVAAYRFGHSLIRERYWLSFTQPNETLAEIFDFIRNPRLPVFSNWVVDFNAFFQTGNSVPVFNVAKKIDSVLAMGLSSLPGLSGMMAQLATRNLRRGLALGLPSGQAMATSMGITPMTSAQLTQGLPINEVALLNSQGGALLSKTPLWYYILREAAVVENGERLGPLGAKIVAETFVRMLKRDAESILNVSGGFTPSLPSLGGAGNFTVADLLIFSGVTEPM